MGFASIVGDFELGYVCFFRRNVESLHDMLTSLFSNFVMGMLSCVL